MDIKKLNEEMERLLEFNKSANKIDWLIADGYGSKDIPGVILPDGDVIIYDNKDGRTLGKINFEKITSVNNEGFSQDVAHELYLLLEKYSKRRILGLFPKQIFWGSIDVPGEGNYRFIDHGEFVFEKLIQLARGYNSAENNPIFRQ